MGRFGYGLLPCTEWYKFFGERLNPKVLIFQPPQFLRQPAPLIQKESICHHTAGFGSEFLLNDGVMKEDEYVAYMDRFMDHMLNRYLSTARKFHEYLSSQKTHVAYLLLIGRPRPARIKREWALTSYRQLESLYRELGARYTVIDGDDMASNGDWLPHIRTNSMKDGGHANVEGNRIIASKVYELIKEWL